MSEVLLLDSGVWIASVASEDRFELARRHHWTLVSTDIRDLVSQGLAITPDAAV